jgi:hypothetical protein
LLNVAAGSLDLRERLARPREWILLPGSGQAFLERILPDVFGHVDYRLVLPQDAVVVARLPREVTYGLLESIPRELLE